MAGHEPAATFTGWARRDWVALLARLTDGFVRAIPPGGSAAAARLPGAADDDRVPGIEGFARMSIAWAAWLHEPSNPSVLGRGDRGHDIAALLARGFADATDPAHPAWWGPIADRDQRIVEAAEVAIAVWLGGERLRAALGAVDPHSLDRVLAWLALVDGRDVWPDNWVLFPMISAIVRRAAGRTVPDSIIDEPLDWMCARHVGDGWYSDGAGRALDLYTGWAIHWHLLWWATIDGARRPRRRSLVIRRARAWLTSVAPLFAADGGFPAFGRSLGYRFATAAPFVQASLLGIDPLVPGAARRLANGVVRRAVGAGVIDPGTDWFRVGVEGERPAVVERYVSAGAVAWAAHTFVALAMPREHPFWASDEAALPADRGQSGGLAAAGAGLLAAWSGSTGETRLYNGRSGHPPDIAEHDYAATYGKLVYRSAFSFDVPIDLETTAGADDAIVAIIPTLDHHGENVALAHRNETDAGSAGPGWIRAEYRLPTRPRPTRVATTVIVADATDIRISAVRPSGAVRFREGGAGLGSHRDARVETVAHDGAGILVLSDGPRIVAIRRLAGYNGTGTGETTASRVNLVHDRARHPFVEESAASSRPRIVAAATVATASAKGEDVADILRAIRFETLSADEAEIRWPGGVARVSLSRRPPTKLVVGGMIVHGPALRIIRATLDGCSVAGESILRVEGIIELDRPGIVAVREIDGRVEATVESGFRLDPAWAVPGLVRLSVRRGAGPWDAVGSVETPGAVPDAVVRRLAGRAGTRLVTIGLERSE
jgi:hypothetical protein